MKSSNKGFTLIELLVVIVIAGIGMSIAVPSFTGMMARNRIATQVNDFTLAINLARSEAGRLGSTVSIQATAPVAANEFGGGWCIVTGNPGNCNDAGDEVLRQFGALTGQSTLDSIEDVERIQFNSRGGLSGTNNARLNFDLCYPGQDGRRIQINIIGRSKSYREAEAGDPDPPAIQPAC